MRPILIVLLATMLAACATTPGDPGARMRAFQADLDAALADWQTRVGQKYYPTSAAATKDLIGRYEEVYTRWGIPADPLSQALMAYSLALAERVDRGQLAPDAANRLLATMRADIDQEKRRLAAVPEGRAGQDAAMLTWWNNYWTANRTRYAASAQRPVVCQVTPAPGAGARVQCL